MTDKEFLKWRNRGAVKSTLQTDAQIDALGDEQARAQVAALTTRPAPGSFEARMRARQVMENSWNRLMDASMCMGPEAS